jgi:hypothetical protein
VLYQESGLHEVVEVSQKNILIIGRTRTGKSTIQNLLVNPMAVPTDISLVSETREPSFRSFMLPKVKLLLNIIDTPGVYERHNDESMRRSEEIILASITKCVNAEITKFHMACFAFSMGAGIQKDDIEALKLFINHLGPDVSENSCLIITRCEMKTASQRERLKRELSEDTEFKKIRPYFKKGIFFTGSLNYDDYNTGQSSVIDQFKNILEYRKMLINEFMQDIKPFEINQSCISEIRKIQLEYDEKIKRLQCQLLSGTVEKEKCVKLIQDLQQQANTERQRVLADNRQKDGGCIIS